MAADTAKGFGGSRILFWVIALLAAILLVSPLRSGDLAGYDDALYSHIAKDIVRTGDWLNLRSNGYPAFEHPPLVPWTQASLFIFFGTRDSMARLPSALSGFGIILLVYWFTRRVTGNQLFALLAMFVMATSIYFIKYAARAMTDVPFTFLFLCSVCCWWLARENPKWYLAAGLFTGLTQMTRSMMGIALPIIFVLDALMMRRRLPWRYLAPAALLAFLPTLVWHARLIHLYGAWFFDVHATFLRNGIYGDFSPPWRRYTGAFEYAWMLAKSYWPWLPAMLAGAFVILRKRDRGLTLLLIWPAVVFGICAASRSRVLRYMLPAYPAFAMLAAMGLSHLLREKYQWMLLRVLTPLGALLVLGVWFQPRVNWHAAEIRPLALASTRATLPSERVGFYDKGEPRFDETNQLQWYGDRYLVQLFKQEDLLRAIDTRQARVFVLDDQTYRTVIASRGHEVIARSGRMFCIRLL